MNEQKQNIMKNLHLTSAEADELLAYDKRIDRGERVEYDLPPEQEKEAKKMANVTTHKPRKKTTRTKKENPQKQEIISLLAEALQDYENVKIENPERIIAFSVGENNFTITLTQKRK